MEALDYIGAKGQIYSSHPDIIVRGGNTELVNPSTKAGVGYPIPMNDGIVTP